MRNLFSIKAKKFPHFKGGQGVDGYSEEIDQIFKEEQILINQ